MTLTRATLIVVLAAVTPACTDRSLVRNASAAYQYQKGIYDLTCPIPPPLAKPCVIQPPLPVNATECQKRDRQLLDYFCRISASNDAIVMSQGGKLPKAARVELKAIRKELDQ